MQVLHRNIIALTLLLNSMTTAYCEDLCCGQKSAKG